jgi:archaellum component FlaF (FlaF/FlaG flagellin family)
MTGREVYSTSYMMNVASGKTEIDLGSLDNGMYLINIKSDKVLYSGKLVRINN